MISFFFFYNVLKGNFQKTIQDLSLPGASEQALMLRVGGGAFPRHIFFWLTSSSLSCGALKVTFTMRVAFRQDDCEVLLN